MSASDPDGDPLTFSLGAGAPSGVLLGSISGQLTWVTGEAQGPSTNVLSIHVQDNGIPPLIATQSLTVVVQETNAAPVLQPISDQSVSEGQLLSLVAVASDTDLPVQQLTFSLVSGAPSGAAIVSSNGVFTWTPSAIQGGQTNLIRIRVTDNGQPPLSTTQSFSVVVFDSAPDFDLGLGTTHLLSGDSTNLPLTLHSGADLTNILAVVRLSGDRLTDLGLESLAPAVGGASLSSIGSNEYALEFNSLPGGTLQGDLQLAHLSFGTLSNEHSAVIKLEGVSVTGLRSTGVPLNSGRVTPGRVFVIGIEPILDTPGLTNGQMVILLYARPGAEYQLERQDALGGSNSWAAVLSLTPTEAKTILTPQALSLPSGFFRAAGLEPSLAPLLASEAPRLDLQLSGHEAFLFLDAMPGQTYTLEATESLIPANWQKVTNITTPATLEGLGTALHTDQLQQHPVRFYRLVSPAY
ncbi:MAG: Ig-like domain-containing protein [Verrucomicrobia bacterium]|nr:Ig-like domain-containing protein [Verrucomicrobiota bacterium]